MCILKLKIVTLCSSIIVILLIPQKHKFGLKRKINAEEDQNLYLFLRKRTSNCFAVYWF